MPKKIKIEYKVTFKGTVTLEDGEELSDVIANMDIPEGGVNNSVYQQDSFELIKKTEVHEGENGEDYIDPSLATHIRVFYGFEGYEIDAADDDGNYIENVWTHYEDEILTLKTAMQVAPLFCDEINRPDLKDKVCHATASRE